MEAQAVHHPSSDTLLAFAAGKLDDMLTAVVVAHLDRCPECCQKAVGLSGDSFLARLRAAQGSSHTPAPSKSLEGLAQSLDDTDARIPPELRDHPQYKIVRELGRGGMGTVYLAKNKLMERLEVLKVVNHEFLDQAGSRDRFLREIRAAARLSHLNIVAAHSALQAGDLLLFSMEYVEGADLARTVKTQGPLPLAHACFYAQQVAQGLQHAFEKGLVHRDIKPQNLMLAREGARHLVKILDFGLAKARREEGGSEHSLTGGGKMLGTPDYIAPEQLRDAASADIRADIYSLGCTLYYLLTGKPPFKGKGLYGLLQAHLTEEATLLSEVRADVPVELAAVVAKMMAKEPGQRYQQPAEVARALAPFLKVRVAPTGSLPAPPEQKSVVEVGSTVRRGAVSGSLTQAAATVGLHPIKRMPKKWLIGAAVAAVLAMGTIAMWADGVFRVRTPDGVLVIDVDEPNPDVYVDGGKVTVTWGAGGKKAEIQVKPGTRLIELKKDGFRVYGKEVTLEDGKRRVLRARLERVQAGPGNVPQPKQEPRDEPKFQGDGFVSLFNGKDLTGWTTRNGAPAAWKVENGYLEVGSGDIRTKQTFGPDFKLHVEFWLPSMPPAKGQRRANSGIFLQGRYEVQILDSFNNDTHTNGSVGALYGLIAPDREAQRKAVRPPQQWNTYDITFQAPRVDNRGNVTRKGRIRVVLNGVTLINDGTFDRVFPFGAIDNKMGTPGPILLQDHGCKVRFRNIRIKELPPSRPAGQGFVPLFNGKDLTGWTTRNGAPAPWKVENGYMVVGPHDIRTKKTFGPDFKLHVEFWLPLMPQAKGQLRANSGIFLQGRYEVQVLDSFNNEVRGYWSVGALYGQIATDKEALRKAIRPPEQWNTFDITFHAPRVDAKGQVTEKGRITVVLNGVTIINAGTFGSCSFGAVDTQMGKPGPIALQDHGARVRFRNIWIKELPPSRPAGQGFVPLFNGKDLTGWRLHPKQAYGRTVEDGLLTGRANQGVTHLFSERAFADFHLRAEVRCNEMGNSGIIFRTPFDLPKFGEAPGGNEA